jgi:hypothetical protein
MNRPYEVVGRGGTPSARIAGSSPVRGGAEIITD